MSLVEAKKGDRVKVTGYHQGQGLNSKLAGLGVHIGDELTIMDGAPFEGPVLVKTSCTESHVAIGHGMAKKVFVELVHTTHLNEKQ